MKLIPLGEQCLIKAEKKAEKTRGGLYIPGTTEKDEMIVGEVIGMGEGVLLESGQYAKPNFNVGDIVIFDRRAGIEVESEDETVMLVKQLNVYAKAEK